MQELKKEPLANEKNIILGDKYRITILTSALIRLEYQENGVFEDMATQKIFNRNFHPCEYVLEDTKEELTVTTKKLKLIYDKKEFSGSGLSAKLYGKGLHHNSVWYYGNETFNLFGTARTLDNVNGKTDLEPGILARPGYAVLDDSDSLVIIDDWNLRPRSEKGIDIYLFAYGHEYKQAIKDFLYLAGPMPMLPRYALGNWWSRFHKYTEESYEKLMLEFEKEGVPFSVAVIDMDWHLVDIDPKYGQGWTGYTWNKELFPDPKKFLQWLHDKGMKVTLNVHPAAGIRAHEECYPEVAKAMGVDPTTEKIIEFDCADPEFMKVYFEKVHHPLEEEGVDFWWIDWQQGTHSKMEGLDPLWMLNHLHFLDSKRDNKRPMTFSRYAGVGSHRYPIGFSGDTHTTWESLDFQPYFTATASNIGYGWWSHDIGGHMLGYRDHSLSVRWYQFGVFSPIMRLHGSWNEFSGKEPWKYPVHIHEIMNRFLKLRHKLIPYLYTMNHGFHKGEPLIQPIYYHYPDSWDAYYVPNQYFFGSEMMVAPITSSQIEKLDMGMVKTWLPEGIYFDLFTNVVYKGGRYLNMYRTLETLPVLVKAGGIIPLTEEIMGEASSKNPQRIRVKIFPGADNRFDLYEDDNETCDYENGKCVTTSFVFFYEKEQSFLIESPVGEMAYLPDDRGYQLEFCCIKDTRAIVEIEGTIFDCKQEYLEEQRMLVLDLTNMPVDKDIRITFEKPLELLAHDLKKTIYQILHHAQIDYSLKEDLFRAVENRDNPLYMVSELFARKAPDSLKDAMVEILTAFDKQ